MTPTVANNGRKGLRIRKRMLVGIVIVGVLLGRLAWFWWLSTPSRQIMIGRETTFLSGPIGADGCVNYVAAIEEQAAAGATPENNAVVLLWEAYGAKETTPEIWAEQFRRLGAPVPPNAMVETVPLDRLVEASQRTRYYAPMIVHSGDADSHHLRAILLPLTQAQHEGVLQLINRAGRRLATGDVEAAWSDALACHRLARLQAQDPILMNSLAAMNHERLALDFDEALLSSTALTALDARRRLTDLQSLPPLPPIAGKVNLNERLMILDTAIALAHGQIIHISQEEQLGLALPGAIDWDIVLRMLNDHYDRYVAALRNPDQAARDAQLAALAAERENPVDQPSFALRAFFGGRQQASHDLARVLLGSIHAGFLTAFDTETSMIERLRAIQVGFALAAWQREHGEYPESLDSLVPGLLKGIPIDPRTGEQLLYLRTESGYEIYRQAVPPEDVILRIGEDEDAVP